MELVSVIIVNYNGKQFLEKCIGTVLHQTYKNFELIIVENGSSDGSAEFIRKEFNDSRIRLFETKENLGFAGGNNLGYRYAKGKYIVLLNNDTIVEKTWLEELVKTISSDEKTGIVQSLVYTEGIPEKYYLKNGTINLLGHNIMEIFDIGADGTGEIFQATGCSMIIRREVCALTGSVFDDDYYMYAEDTYISFLSRFAGFKSLHNANSVVYHKGSGTTRKFKAPLVTYYQERNRLLNYDIFFGSAVRKKLIPYKILNLAAKITASLFSRSYSLKGVLKAYFWLLRNKKLIESKREKINPLKTVPETDILKLLSCKVLNGNNYLFRFINYLSYFYCRMAGIQTIEMNG